MVRLAAGLIGTYFVAFAATNLVVAGDHGLHRDQKQPAAAAAKGDRIGGGADSSESDAPKLRRVSEVELIGADGVLVILRDGDGREVYRVDAASGMTIAARDVAIPALRLHADLSEDRARKVPEPTVPQPAAPGRAPAAPGLDGFDEEAGEEQVFACESGLSALADRRAASLPRVCLSEVSVAREHLALATGLR